MINQTVLKKYIDRCDEVLNGSKKAEAELLVKEILGVFNNDIPNLNYKLSSAGMYYEGKRIDFFQDIYLLRAKLQKEYETICPENDIQKNKQTKILISHSSKDEKYILEIVKLLESLGLREDDIICSSVVPYCIPLNGDIYSWLAEAFRNNDLHVFFALSENYYKSIPAVNEMGAAWVMKQKSTLILLPGFEFRDIKGCVNTNQIGIKLDDADSDTLHHRLNELKDDVIKEFQLRDLPQSLWERKRNEFLYSIESLIKEKSDDLHNELEEELSNEEGLLLIYAAESDGLIMVVNSITRFSPEIEAGNHIFTKEDDARKTAIWEHAIEKLANKGFIKKYDSKINTYKVTAIGYTEAAKINASRKVDTRKDPQIYV